VELRKQEWKRLSYPFLLMSRQALIFTPGSLHGHTGDIAFLWHSILRRRRRRGLPYEKVWDAYQKV